MKLLPRLSVPYCLAVACALTCAAGADCRGGGDTSDSASVTAETLRTTLDPSDVDASAVVKLSGSLSLATDVVSPEWAEFFICAEIQGSAQEIEIEFRCDFSDGTSERAPIDNLPAVDPRKGDEIAKRTCFTQRAWMDDHPLPYEATCAASVLDTNSTQAIVVSVDSKFTLTWSDASAGEAAVAVQILP
jgi:hypothetical protein